MDRFRVEVLSQTPKPQQVIYGAMHQDYTGEFVFDGRESWPSESECGEIIVKRLLAGDRGHYGCFSADTEVLTDRGWLPFPLVTKETQLLAVDPNKGSAHFEIPSAIQAIEFNPADKMYSVESQYLNFLVTPDHRMLVSSRQSGGKFSSWRFEEAREIYNKPVRYLLNAYLDESQRSIPDFPEGIDPFIALKLAGFFFGDGLRSDSLSPGVIRFKIRRPRKIAYLMSLGLPLSEMKGDRYTVQSKSLASWVHSNFQEGEKKTIPSWALRLPSSLVAAFWDGLKNSDGTRVKKKSWGYDSCEKEALGTIQAIAHINGFSANMTLNNPNVGMGHENHRPCWRLTISEHSTRRVESCQKTRSPGIKEDWVDYSDKVYCATVSTGALMVRREGKVVVLGNCLEHPQIVLNCGYFPHSVMQQARTHRVGVSFDVQCLAGDTEVTFIKASGSLRKIKIADLYEIWENGEKGIRTRKIVGRNGEPPGEYRRDAKKRIKKMSLRVLNEETGNFQISHIKNVMCSGVQPIYRLTLEDGKTLDCTTNHRLLTSQGWQTLRESVGLITNDNHDVIALTKECEILCNGIVRSYSPKLGMEDWGKKPKQKGRKLKAHPVKVLKVEYLGEQMTYDIEVEGKWHNFVANGLVVHNSFRYTGQQFLEVLNDKKDIEDVFYLRPVGNYRDRQGKSYYYSPEQRETDLKWCLEAIQRYQQDMTAGLSEEHARGKLPFDYRQHFVVSFNLRSLLHFLDLRSKKDAQLEIQKLCDLMLPHLEIWVPDVAKWYKNTRLGKARLSP